MEPANKIENFLQKDQVNFYLDLEKLQEEIHLPIEFNDKIIIPTNQENCRLMRVMNLTYEKDFPRLEAFENVVASINNNQNCRIVYYLRGTEKGVEFYIGIIEKDNNKTRLSIRDYRDLLEKSFKGNFVGTHFQFDNDKNNNKKEKEQTNILQEKLLDKSIKYSVVLGVPSKNEEKEEISFQGVDRLVNIMSGTSFHMIVIWESVHQKELKLFDEKVKKIYGDLVYWGKHSIQESGQYSYQKGENEGSSISDTKGKNEGSQKQNVFTSEVKNKNVNISRTESTNKGTSNSGTIGVSKAITREVQDKVAQELIKYIDEELLLRLKQGQAKGMYKTTMYLGAELNANLTLLENSVKSIFQGDKSTFFPLHARRLPETDEIRKVISNFDFIDCLPANSNLLPLCSRPIFNRCVGLSTWLTSSEISILAGIPQKEVPGLELREQVGFGLNNIAVEEKEAIYLGLVYQEGSLLKNNKVWLNKEDLNKHIFIAGTTGSGKTTTCHRLLDSSKMPFLVIEPAKTEYRVLLNDPNLNEKNLDKETIKERKANGKPYGEILLFTVGNESGVPFRFNPFEFSQTENLSGHVDLLKACFMASFNMEAAIPNLLEESLYKIYERFGWNFRDNTNIFLKNRNDAWNIENGGKYFPTISDYIDIFESVVSSKGFDDRLKNDYLGSMRGRLDSLRTGTKKIMFDTRLSINFDELLDRRVIIELEELKSGEDKSFIMGLILGRLVEALKARHKKQADYKHITLVEEAHRLLSCPMSGDSPNKKLGVEMFADLLAEVRKYGESLIIVDQIPNKLAPEVLKNTNTKIIHKIFARDDKEAVGDTMALDEKQRNYLSHLLPGEAIIFSQGWLKPIDTQIEQLSSAKTTQQEINEEEVFTAGWKYWEENYIRFCPILAQNSLYKNVQFVSKQDLLNLTKWVINAENAIYRLTQKNESEFWLAMLTNARKELNKELAHAIFSEVFFLYIFSKKLLNDITILDIEIFENKYLKEAKEIVSQFLNCQNEEEVNQLLTTKKIKCYL